MIFGARIRIHFTITYLMQGGIHLHLTHVARRRIGRYYSMNFWYVSFGALTPGAAEELIIQIKYNQILWKMIQISLLEKVHHC
jgi:hypothetical protein